MCYNYSMKIIVGITGASGVIYGIKFLEVLNDLEIESILILSEWGEKNIKIETSYTLEYVKSLANHVLDNNNMAASISSGSYKTDGMVIIPCSMKTLGSVATGLDDNLISRAASVCLKESRKIILVPRETPLSRIHLSNMLKLSKLGVIILPAMPGFYFKPKTIEDMVLHISGKVLDQLQIEHNLFKRWHDTKQ